MTDEACHWSNDEVLPVFDYRQGLHSRREEIMAAINRVLDSGTLVLGQEVTAFEREFAAFIGSRFAVGASSGTDALIVALRALEIGDGDEVITVANGPVPTLAAIRAVGARPRFVDVDPITLQMDGSSLNAALNAKTRCVVPVHLYGAPSNVVEISRFCRERGLSMIEDCAQAHGTHLGAIHAGNFGAIGCFSFYPTKNLGAFGDAGMCVTNDEQLAARMRELVCYGFRGDRIAHREGLNCRLDELQAACLRVQLRHLPSSLAKRALVAERYMTELSNSAIRLPRRIEHATVAWHLFVVRVKMREAWIQWLSEHKIQTAIHYAHPVHLMPAYQPFGNGVGSLPVTELACREVLSLPMFPELGNACVARIVDALQAGLRAGLM